MQIDPSKITWDQSPPASGGLRPLGPPNPKLPGEVQGQALSNTKTADEIRRARALEEAQRRKAVAEAAMAEQNLRKSQSPAAAINPEAAGKARERMNQAILFRQQLQEVNRLWKETQQGGGVGGIMEYFPTPANKQFDKAASGLKALARTLFKTPGDQMTEFEGKPIMDMIPDRWSFDKANIQSINQLDRLAREIIAQNAPLVGKKPVYNKPKGKTRVINFDDLPE